MQQAECNHTHVGVSLFLNAEVTIVNVTTHE